jgi:hypothetical protein
LCLVPSGPGKYNAVAIVLASGLTYIRWTQNFGNHITFPSRAAQERERTAPRQADQPSFSAQTAIKQCHGVGPL